jgi:hypothetical protein
MCQISLNYFLKRRKSRGDIVDTVYQAGLSTVYTGARKPSK